MVLPIAILTPALCCLLQHEAAGRSTACPHEFQRIVSLLPLGIAFAVDLCYTYAEIQ